MMWNWLVSVLAVGAAIVLYDGSPLVPHANILWDLVDKIGYVSVKYMQSLKQVIYILKQIYLDFVLFRITFVY